MSDNTTISTPLNAGDRIRDVDRGSVKTQVVIIDLNTGSSENLMTGQMPVQEQAQKSSTQTFQNQATSNGNGTVATTDGYNGAQQLFVGNGAGTATLTVQGSLDQTFAVAQDTAVLGLVKLWDSTNGTNTNRTVISGVLSLAANTSYLFAVMDVMPYVRAPISSASGLGAGTSDTGVTAKLYSLPM